jgi:hypothetical protein
MGFSLQCRWVQKGRWELKKENTIEKREEGKKEATLKKLDEAEEKPSMSSLNTVFIHKPAAERC